MEPAPYKCNKNNDLFTGGNDMYYEIEPHTDEKPKPKVQPKKSPSINITSLGNCGYHKDVISACTEIKKINKTTCNFFQSFPEILYDTNILIYGLCIILLLSVYSRKNKILPI